MSIANSTNPKIHPLIFLYLGFMQVVMRQFSKYIRALSSSAFVIGNSPVWESRLEGYGSARWRLERGYSRNPCT